MIRITLGHRNKKCFVSSVYEIDERVIGRLEYINDWPQTCMGNDIMIDDGLALVMGKCMVSVVHIQLIASLASNVH